MTILKTSNSNPRESCLNNMMSLRGVVVDEEIVSIGIQEEKRSMDVDKIDSNSVISKIQGAIYDKNIHDLDRFIENGAIYSENFDEEQAKELWELCWELWAGYNSVEQRALGVFMSCLKAAYPRLPGHPAWIIIGNLEEK